MELSGLEACFIASVELSDAESRVAHRVVLTSGHRERTGRGMCRNIRPLFNFEPPATDAEMEAAALQYVRKVSGFTRPSKANEVAFDRAVQAVRNATRDLMADLITRAEPKDRELEAAKARERSRKRFGG